MKIKYLYPCVPNRLQADNPRLETIDKDPAWIPCLVHCRDLRRGESQRH
jgi:hypothetical protein